MGAEQVLLTCPDIGLPCIHKGKVRELFDLGDHLLMVATDRISAFDVVFPTGIPGKGQVLTAISELWFGATAHIAPNHLVTTAVSGLGLQPEHEQLLSGRSMVVRRARRIDVECVVRGYLAGSGWKEYQERQTVTNIALPPGLQQNSELPRRIFTPALKRDHGHDENVPFARVEMEYGSEAAGRLRDVSINLYEFARGVLAPAGIILADTKFEFGWCADRLTIIDEIFTPDSSRYWPADGYRPGRPIDSLDKQPLRDWAEASGWNKEPPAPDLPVSLVTETARRYQSILQVVRQALRPKAGPDTAAVRPTGG